MRTSLLLVALLLSLPLFAQSPNNELAISYGEARYDDETAEASNEQVGSLSYNRFWTRSVSTRLGVTRYGVRPTIELGSDGGTDINATTLTVEWHILRDNVISPYAGVGIAYASTKIVSRHFDDSADGELTGLATAGADLNIARWVAVGAVATVMLYEPELESGATAQLNPVSVSAAVKFRW